MKYKNNKGITLISLVITIIVMAVISSAMIYNSKNQFGMKRINDLYSDIQILNTKIDEYYLKYGELPVLAKYKNENYDNREFFDYIVNYSGANSRLSYVPDGYIELLEQQGITDSTDKYFKLREIAMNQNDDKENYYVIDLEKLDGLTLNYGYGEAYAKVKNGEDAGPDDELYFINSRSHQIYFPYGIEDDGVLYYTYDL